MSHHELKTWPVHFEAVWRGDKTFEVRLDDRAYQCGDTVTLREWDRRDPCTCFDGPQPAGQAQPDHRGDCEKYSGREIRARVGHVLASTPPRGSQRGFNGNGYVVFSVCDPQKRDGRAGVLTPAKAAAHIAAGQIRRDAAL